MYTQLVTNSVRLGILLPLALLCWGCPVDASDAAPALEVVVSVDRQALRIDEILTLDVRIRNRSDRPVNVFGKLLWGPRAGIVVEFFDAKTGERAFTGKFDDNLIPPNALEDRDLYTTLQPGHYLGRSRRLLVSDFVPSSGDYNIRVAYRGPTRPFAARDAIRWENAVPGPPIRIQVQPSEGQR